MSTRNQKDDLLNQVAFLRQFCNAKGIIVDQCIEDYGRDEEIAKELQDGNKSNRRAENQDTQDDGNL